MPGLPVHHQLPELARIHVHQVSDAIQPSHPLSSPYPPAFYLSQHQGVFQCSHAHYFLLDAKIVNVTFLCASKFFKII